MTRTKESILGIETSLTEDSVINAESHEDEHAGAPMAAYQVKSHVIEEGPKRDARLLAATCNVFMSRYWLDDFPENALGYPLWDDTENNYVVWEGMREIVAKWKTEIANGSSCGVGIYGDDLVIFDDLKVRRPFRRLGVGSALCRFVRTTLVSPHAGALIVALVNKENEEAFAFWRSFGLCHPLGTSHNCVVLAGQWQGAYSGWTNPLENTG